MGEHPKTIEHVLSQLGVYLKSSMYSLDTKPLLKEVRLCGQDVLFCACTTSVHLLTLPCCAVPSCIQPGCWGQERVCEVAIGQLSSLLRQQQPQEQLAGAMRL